MNAIFSFKRLTSWSINKENLFLQKDNPYWTRKILKSLRKISNNRFLFPVHFQKHPKGTLIQEKYLTPSQNLKKIKLKAICLNSATLFLLKIWDNPKFQWAPQSNPLLRIPSLSSSLTPFKESPKKMHIHSMSS